MTRSSLEAALRGAPGWATAVFDAGGVRDVQHHGSADLAAGAPVEAETRFRWFSVTKVLTAMLVMRLVEEGRLGLDDAVGAHLPYAKHEPLTPPITVRHLLAHVSGLGNPPPVGWVRPEGGARRTPSTLTRRVLDANRAVKTTPGTKGRYSNLNYLLLGEIAAAAARQSYAGALAGRVLGPLGMTDTSFETDRLARGHERWASARVAVMAALFRPARRYVAYRSGPWIGLEPFLLEGQAYGGLMGPLDDLVRVGRCLLGGGELDGSRVLSDASVHAMFEPPGLPSDAPFGLGVWREGEWRVHGGGAGGYRSELWLHPGRGVGVAVLANAGRAPADGVASLLAADENTADDRWRAWRRIGRQLR